MRNGSIAPQIGLLAIASALACALVLEAGAGSAVAAKPSPCAQAPQSYWVFNSYNQCATLNGAKSPAVTLAKPANITGIADYHFDNGTHTKPGTIGFEASNGYIFGPFKAKQQTGTWDWVTTTNFTVPAGTYTIVDSDPATWSQNTFSGGRGFVRVFGAFVATAPPVPKPAAGGGGSPSPTPTTPATPTCATPAPSTYLITPNHVASGGKTSFLLSCQTPAASGFKGSFAPLKVEVYDEASFRNLKYINGYLQPISPSFTVRPPIVLVYSVAGPHDIEVTLPGSIHAGTYVAIVVYAHGEVASQNLLIVS